MLLFTYIAVVIVLLYGLTILLFTYGWHKAILYSSNTGTSRAYEPDITVIVPFRNEENTLGPLLQSIEKIAYQQVTFLFVNDHSIDRGCARIETYMKHDNRVQLHHLPGHEWGKKMAIKWGVEMANTEIIITTDADCILPSNWISTMVFPFQHEKTQLVAGPVTGKARRGLLNNVILLDLLSLVGTGLGAAGIRLPMYCNAANMAFRKTAFQRYLQSKLGQESISGDDVFLLHHIKARYGAEAIRVMISKACLVSTTLPESISQFLKQRVRWASKSRFYKDFFTISTSLLVYSMNLLLTLSLIWAIFTHYRIPFLFTIAAKILIDSVFFYMILGFFSKRGLLPLTWVYQGFYFLYISFLAPIAVLRGGIRWKE